MTSVNEQLVRDYLELLGFCVRQGRKYSVIARAKASWEEADLLGVNPSAATMAGPLPAPGLWGASELTQVPSVAISVRGWHTDRFTPQMIANTPELVRFAAPEAMESARRTLGVVTTAAVLVLPELPHGAQERAAAVDFLVAHGVQGVVLFRTMLLELLDRIDVKKSYEKSDVLQMLRILKVHRLVQSRQMVLGEWGPGIRRRKDTPAKSPDEMPPEPPETPPDDPIPLPLEDGPDALSPDDDPMLPGVAESPAPQYEIPPEVDE